MIQTIRPMHKVWRGVFSLVLGLLLMFTLDGNPALAATSTSSSKAAATTAGATQEKVQSRPQTRAAAPSLMPPEIQQILDQGTLTVAVLGRDNSPFFMEKDGQLAGWIFKSPRPWLSS